jgi:hypothetical protein
MTVFIGAALLVSASCDSSTPRPSAFGMPVPPAMVFLDSSRLSLSWPSAEPPLSAVSASGTLYLISDDSTVSVFSETGAHLSELRVPMGALGSGRRPKALAVMGDSLISYLSEDGRTVALQKLPTGEVQWSRQLLATSFDVQLSAGVVHTASYDGDSATIIRHVSSDSTLITVVAKPDAYRMHSGLQAALGNYVFNADRSTGVLMFPGDAHVFFWFPSGRQSRMYVPPLRRLGTVALEEGSTSASAHTRTQVSLPQFIDVLTDSTALIVYRDSSAQATTRRLTYFTAIINAKRSQVCLDIELPQLANRNVRFFLRKDTLEALVLGDVASSNTSITRMRYRVSVAACAWLGVQPGI